MRTDGVVPQLLRYDFGDSAFAFSSTREGGVSVGNYGEFNANFFSGDDVGSVVQNRNLLCSLIGISPSSLIVPHQTHSDKVFVVDYDFLSYDAERKVSLLDGVDALVTREKNVCICVSTADCVPLLLYDDENKVVAAVHAGWRGTLKRIASKTAQKMVSLYGTDLSRLRVVIGPCISVQSYEVGNEVVSLFSDNGFPVEEFAICLGEGKSRIDLPGINNFLLESIGIKKENIHDVGICTFRTSERFFSARKLGVNSGRILNGIMLR